MRTLVLFLCESSILASGLVVWTAGCRRDGNAVLKPFRLLTAGGMDANKLRYLSKIGNNCKLLQPHIREKIKDCSVIDNVKATCQ